MLKIIWNEILIRPIFNLLFIFTYYTNSLGLSIILLTILIKLLLFPVNIPSIKMASKKSLLDKDLSKLKKKYKNNKTLLSKKQMELYKKHGINPASGCLPNILQILVLIALYRVFIGILNNSSTDTLFYFSFLKDISFSTKFLLWDLAKPDSTYILPVASAGVQFITSKLMLPTVNKSEKIAKKTETTQDDMMVSMQKNMIYTAPLMTLIIGAKLPSGLILYWFISSLFSFFQSYYLKKYVYAKKST